MNVCCFKEKVTPPCEMTERRIFTMAKQVASALVSILINLVLTQTQHWLVNRISLK